ASLDRLAEQAVSGDGCHGVPSPLRGHVLGGPLNRLDDVVIAGAPAQIAFELVPDLRLGRLRVAFEHLVGCQDHAGCAEAALQPVLLPEPLLDRLQLAVLGQSLDRRDIGAVHLDGEEGAGLDGVAVHEDRARAALARVAADVGPGQADRLTNVVHQEKAGLHVMAVALAVDRHLDWQFHESSSGIRRFESGSPPICARERKSAAAGCQRGVGGYGARSRRPSARAWSRTSRTGRDFSRAMRATSANSGVTVTIRPERRETLKGMAP